MAKRSIGKYCVVKQVHGFGRGKKVSCHKYLRVAKKEALRVGGIVTDNMDCKKNRGARCGIFDAQGE